MGTCDFSENLASITDGFCPPYLENLTKVAVTAMKSLQTKAQDTNNPDDAKELSESIANIVTTINTLVKMDEECGRMHFKDICTEMEGYLRHITKVYTKTQGKHSRVMDVVNPDEFRDDIQAYRKRVDDLKMDFLIHVMGDCMSAVTKINKLQSDIERKWSSYSSQTSCYFWPAPQTYFSVALFFFFFLLFFSSFFAVRFFK